jgi:hypothetical protein
MSLENNGFADLLIARKGINLRLLNGDGWDVDVQSRMYVDRASVDWWFMPKYMKITGWSLLK